MDAITECAIQSIQALRQAYADTQEVSSDLLNAVIDGIVHGPYQNRAWLIDTLARTLHSFDVLANNAQDYISYVRTIEGIIEFRVARLKQEKIEKEQHDLVDIR